MLDTMRGLPKYFRQFKKKLLLSDRLVMAVFFAGLVFLFKKPFWNLPFWWDEENYLEGSLKVLTNGFRPFVEWWSYKPPFLYEITALFFRLFGFCRVIPRALIAFFSFLAVYFTFLLGAKLYGRLAGLAAALWLFFTPLFFAQSGLFQADLPLTALSLITIYYFFSSGKIAYFFSAALLVLTKEPGVLVILSIIAYELLLNPGKVSSKKLFRRVLFLASPLLIFFIWMVLNRVLLGWWLWPYNLDYFKHSAPLLASKLKTILSFIFYRDFHIWLSFLIGGAFLSAFFFPEFKEKLIKKELLLFLILALTETLFFWKGAFLPRYLLPVYPLFFLTAAVSMTCFFEKKFFSWLILGLFIGLFIFRWKTDRVIWAGEISLDYLRAIGVHQAAADYLENNFYDFPIFTLWPLYSELANPNLGYVKKPLKNVYYLKDIGQRIFDETGTGFILVNQIFRGREIREKLDRFLAGNELVLIRQFGFSGEKVSLYQTADLQDFLGKYQ
ncbi:MAG: glycosyltransferase family 39 protein [Candidatus Pacebacteria bacterium]|nr:glycosyltransferase family 39 protein [Candidatus Paceibacterota bacterium]